MGNEKKPTTKKISLAPLDFETAVSDLLKVKLPPKTPAKPRQPKSAKS